MELDHAISDFVTAPFTGGQIGNLNDIDRDFASVLLLTSPPLVALVSSPALGLCQPSQLVPVLWCLSSYVI